MPKPESTPGELIRNATDAALEKAYNMCKHEPGGMHLMIVLEIARRDYLKQDQAKERKEKRRKQKAA